MAASAPPPPGGLPQRLRAADHELRLAAACAVASNALYEAGIEHLVIKGPAARAALWGGGDQRRFVDVDILIAADRADALRALTTAGFAPAYPGAAPSEISPHATELVRAGAVVDLHHRLPAVRVAPQAAWQCLLVHRVNLDWAGQIVPAVDAVASTALAAIDAIRGGGEGRATADLRRAVDTLDHDGWASVLGLATALGVRRELQLALELLPDSAGVRGMLGVTEPIPAAVRQRLLSPPPLAPGLDQLRAAGSWVERSRFVARRVVPTPEALRFWRPWAARSTGHLVLAYLYRLWYLATRLPFLLRGWLRWLNRRA